MVEGKKCVFYVLLWSCVLVCMLKEGRWVEKEDGYSTHSTDHPSVCANIYYKSIINARNVKLYINSSSPTHSLLNKFQSFWHLYPLLGHLVIQ